MGNNSGKTKGIGTDDTRAELYRFIEGIGHDKYISLEEEREVLLKADSLLISDAQAEAMLNLRCRRNKWIRESDVTFFLRVMLEAATKDDGLIDKKEFEQAVNFAVALLMPRKDAGRICHSIIVDSGWKAKPEKGMMGLSSKNWLDDYEG